MNMQVEFTETQVQSILEFKKALFDSNIEYQEVHKMATRISNMVYARVKAECIYREEIGKTSQRGKLK